MVKCTPEECRTRAAACERVAKNMIDPKSRQMMLEIAARWRALADSDDRPALNDGRRDVATGGRRS
jgi:hypothetical protein